MSKKRNSDEVITSGEKRKRDPTFTASEKLALIDLVENHFDIIECKKTDAVTMRQKTDEWRKISSEFNATSSIHPRDWTVLKNCWENLKKRAKQELTQRNQHFLGTGGGPPKKKNEDPATERVMDLIQPRVSGHINIYDSDSTNIASCSQTSATTSREPVPCAIIDDAGETIPEISQETEVATTMTVDWSQYTPSMLRDARHPSLILQSTSHVDEELVEHVEHEQQPPSSPPLADLTGMQVDTVTTPRVQHCAPARSRPTTSASRSRPTSSSSRRRPTVTHAIAPETMTTHRIATLALANSQAEEEHEVKMRILKLQEEKEKELLKQEVLRTKQEEIKLEMLLLELKKLKE